MLMRVASIVLVATLGACTAGGSSYDPSVYPRANGSARAAVGSRSLHGQSISEADALLYVGGGDGLVTVYAYPSGKLVQTLRGFNDPEGMCIDSHGDVFITDLGYGRIFEYAHGGTKRIAGLEDTGRDPVGCSVDPTTGNLAVTSLGFGKPADVAIYAHARGRPIVYTDPSFAKYFYCAYDESGNLYVDGQAPSSYAFQLAELPKGKSSFTDVTLNQGIGFPGNVQWVGGNLVVGDKDVSAVYEFIIAGSSGKLVGTTELKGTKYVDFSWVHGSRIVIANGGGTKQSAMIFDFPAGGKAIKIIRRGVAGPHGLVVSTTSS